MDSNWISQLPELDRAEVVVCGGGPAGVTAALSAARQGASVLLLEQRGALGGMATLGLVPMLATVTDGVNPVAEGIGMEISREVVKLMGVTDFKACWQQVNPEIFKRVCDEKIQAAGIKIYFDQKIAAVRRDGNRVSEIAVAGIEGLKKVSGKVFVDTTGDAAVTAFAGGKFELGDEKGITMSPTLCVTYAGIDWDKYFAAEQAGRSFRSIWHKMLAEGKTPIEEHHFVGIFKTGPCTGGGNLGHIYGINCAKDADITKGYIEGRKIAVLFHKFFAENVEGFEKSELAETASLLSVRETRRIVGDYKLCKDDYLKRKSFADDIARYSYPVDIHASSTDAADQQRVEREIAETRYQPGENYGIPYRALLPQGLDNVLVAGRCVCCDRPVQSSLRVMPACFLTGQAAGMAAALSLNSNADTRAVNTDQLRKALREKVGAWLP